MSKFTENFVKYLKAYLLTAFIAFVIGVITFLLVFFFKEKSLSNAIDGCTIAFVGLLGVGGLMWLAELGSFDSLAYGFKQLFTTQFAKKANKYNDYAGYLQEKKAVRAHSPHLYFAFIFTSLIFGIALAILEIILHTS